MTQTRTVILQEVGRANALQTPVVSQKVPTLPSEEVDVPVRCPAGGVFEICVERPLLVHLQARD